MSAASFELLCKRLAKRPYQTSCLFTTYGRESQGGTEAAFQTEPSGQIRTKWATPFILGQWSVCLRVPCAGAGASPRAGWSLTGSPAISELEERRDRGLCGDRGCWGRCPVSSSFCVSYRKPTVPSKAEVLLPLYISCLAAESLLEKKKQKNPQRGAWNSAVCLRHTYGYVHTHAHTAEKEPKGTEA